MKHDKGEEFARFSQLALAELAVDGSKQSLHIGKITLQQPHLKATLNERQELDLAELLIDQPPAKPSKEKKEKPAPASKPWQWQINQIAISKGDITLTEASSGKPLARQLSDLQLALGPLGSKSEQQSKVALSTRFNQKSPLAFDGQLTLAPFTLAGEITQQALPLVLAQPYLNDLVRIKVK